MKTLTRRRFGKTVAGAAAAAFASASLPRIAFAQMPAASLLYPLSLGLRHRLVSG
jgi:hypothetical protein